VNQKLDGVRWRARRRRDSPCGLDGCTSEDAALVGVLLRDRLRLRGAGGGDPRAHYLHTVLDRGAGIPIACSAIWIAVGARAEIPIEGVNLPGHFVVPRRRAPLRHDRERRAPRRGGRQATRHHEHRTGDRASRTGSGGAGERTRHARAHVAKPASLLHEPRVLGPGAARRRPLRRPHADAGGASRSRAAPVAHGQGRGPRSPTSPAYLDEAPETCPDRTAMTEVAGRLRAFLN
jgi:hypothetical protein